MLKALRADRTAELQRIVAHAQRQTETATATALADATRILLHVAHPKARVGSSAGPCSGAPS